MKLEYVDLYLVQWCFPKVDYYQTPAKTTSPALHQIWEVLEKLVEQGLIKSIGVCNCNVMTLANLIAGCKIPPAVNQVQLLPFVQ